MRVPMRSWIGCLLFFLIASPGAIWSEPSQAALEEQVWFSLWGEMLSRHTRSVDAEVGTAVDYTALTQDPLWSKTVVALGEADPSLLGTRDQKLAFWINAYNILAIDVVVQNYPVESIRDIGWFLSPVWKRTAGTIHGRPYSLDEIEHEILRPMGEPRIHGAIVCSAVSCPNLLREPYRSDVLDAQFDASLRAWMLRPEKGMKLDRKQSVLRVSRIFDWFEDDFDGAGGVLAFVTRYAPLEEAAWLRTHRANVSLKYLPYDWRLND